MCDCLIDRNGTVTYNHQDFLLAEFWSIGTGHSISKHSALQVPSLYLQYLLVTFTQVVINYGSSPAQQRFISSSYHPWCSRRVYLPWCMLQRVVSVDVFIGECISRSLLVEYVGVQQLWPSDPCEMGWRCGSDLELFVFAYSLPDMRWHLAFLHLHLNWWHTSLSLHAESIWDINLKRIIYIISLDGRFELSNYLSLFDFLLPAHFQDMLPQCLLIWNTM
jgi:hypothetical protein